MFLGELSFGKSLEEGRCVGWEVACFASVFLGGLSFGKSLEEGHCVGWEVALFCLGVLRRVVFWQIT